MSAIRPTLGIYTPLPGSASGIADYSLTGSTLLSGDVRVEFISLDNYRCPYDFDLVLYQMGGGRESVAAFRAAAERPGPMILHEHILSQFFVENHDLLDANTNRQVREIFGDALHRTFDSSEELAALMKVDRSLQYLDLGLERIVVERATFVFTHSWEALAELEMRYEGRVRPLDFPVKALTSEQRMRARGALGISDGVTVFGSLGFVGRHKRLPQVLHAWAELDVPSESGRLLVVGRGAAELRHLANATTTIVEYVPSGDEFWSLVAAVDIGVQLREPSLGETSGVVAHMLASDVPVITSRRSVLPIWANSEMVRIVPPSADETGQLAGLMQSFLTHRPTGQGRRSDKKIVPWRESVLAALEIGEGTGALEGE